MSLVDALLVALTLVGVYFVPGFIWSYVFFPEATRTADEPSDRSSAIGIVERVVLSVGLSFALVPLLLFIANQISGIPVDGMLTGVTTLLVAGLGLVMIYLVSRNVYVRLLSVIKSVRARLLRS